MGPQRPAPLLPVHSKGAKRKTKGNSFLRLVILAALFVSIGYGLFAFNYVGKSSHRKDVEDSHILDQLKRPSLTEEHTRTGRALADESGAHAVAEPDPYDDDVTSEHAKHAHAVGHASQQVHNAKHVEHSSAAHHHVEPTHGSVPHHHVESTHEREEAHAPGLAVGSHLEADAHTGESHVPGHQASPDVTTTVAHASPAAHSPIVAKLAEPDLSQHDAATKQPEIHTHEEAKATLHEAEKQQVPARAPDVDAAKDDGHHTVVEHSKDVVPMEHGASQHLTTTTAAAAAQGLYSMEAVDIDGHTQPLSKYAGKVTVVVNVASACGFTDANYKGLMQTYEKYKSSGLEVLGFPCNQFGAQEAGSETQIKEFCTSKYHVTFPMFSKVEVNGPNAHPIYKWLKQHLPVAEGGGGGTGPGRDLIWNFQKIVVNHLGMPVKLFYQDFDAISLEGALYKLLHEAREAKIAAA